MNTSLGLSSWRIADFMFSRETSGSYLELGLERRTLLESTELVSRYTHVTASLGFVGSKCRRTSPPHVLVV